MKGKNNEVFYHCWTSNCWENGSRDEVSKNIGLSNHMTIELAKSLYGEMNENAWRLVGKLREDIWIQS